MRHVTAPKHTLIVDRYESTACIEDAGSNNYKGLRIHALPGLHDFVGEQVSKHLRYGSKALDIAAGSGAMCLRLSDLGFSVDATDYVRSGFKLNGSIPFTEIDLNLDFADAFGSRYESIVASEIIEHLENPRHFARQIFALLRPGGRVLLTTPNIDSIPSKILFLSSGSFLWFEDQQYRSDGHISPLSQGQLQKIFSEAGFSLVAQSSFGSRFERLSGSPRLKLLTWLLGALFAPQPGLGGEIYVVVFERPLQSA